MADKKYKTIAEIDAELDKAFKEAQEEIQESEEKEASPETESEDTDETVEAEPVEEAVEEAEVETKEGQPEEKESEPKQPEAKVDSKPTKEDKKDYAFKQLRQEAELVKEELAGKKQLLSEIELLAQSQGFSNVDEFLRVWRERQLEEQAKKQNIDPKVLKELQETKDRLAKIEIERNEAVKRTNINRVNTIISKFATTNKIPESDMEKIIAKMGEDNVSIDILVSTPKETLEKMLTGYAQDIIIERKVQEKLAALEKTGNSPAPEKHKNTVTSKKPDPFSKEALEDEMAQFKKQNYPWLK